MAFHNLPDVIEFFAIGISARSERTLTGFQLFAFVGTNYLLRYINSSKRLLTINDSDL